MASLIQEGWSKQHHAPTQIEHPEDLAARVARASAGKCAIEVSAPTSRGVAAGARPREVVRRRGDEVAGIGRPAEAGVEVQLGPVVFASFGLAVGLEHDGAAGVALEIGEADLRAGLQEAAGGAHDAGWAKSSGGDGSEPHLGKLLMIFKFPCRLNVVEELIDCNVKGQVGLERPAMFYVEVDVMFYVEVDVMSKVLPQKTAESPFLCAYAPFTVTPIHCHLYRAALYGTS